MNNLLVVKSSILGGASVSSELADELIRGLNQGEQRLQVLVRNLNQQAIPHLDSEWLQALTTPEADRTDTQQRKVDFSNQLISEVQKADTLVVTAPMYNFSIPSNLKAWNDHLARAGTTFKYTDKGPVGLLTGKKVYLVVSMGGAHEPGITDFVTPYLNAFFGFLGMTDVEVILANRLNMGAEHRARGISSAQAEIRELVAADQKQSSKAA